MSLKGTAFFLFARRVRLTTKGVLCPERFGIFVVLLKFYPFFRHSMGSLNQVFFLGRLIMTVHGK